MKSQNGFILDILTEIELFSELDYNSLTNLSNLFEEKIYNQDEIIFKEDSIGTSMMMITSGEVRISQISDPQTEEALIILKKGDVFGEMALLEDMPRSATVIANTNVIIFEVQREKFLSFLENNKEAGVKILMKLAKILSSRLRETDAKVKAFVSLTKWI
jgi:CRP-like cAMP-binding protein